MANKNSDRLQIEHDIYGCGCKFCKTEINLYRSEAKTYGIMQDELLALLDKIAIQRFDIVKDCGYDIIFGCETSGAMN